MVHQRTSPLGAHGRIQVASMALGATVVFSESVVYPNDRVPTVEFLRARLVELQQRFPSTHVRLVPKSDEEGEYVWGLGPAHPVDQLLTMRPALGQESRTTPEQTAADIVTDCNGRLFRVFQEAQKRATPLDVSALPLFHVFVTPTPSTTHITLSIAHVLTDGIGGSHLLHAILATPEQFAALPDEAGHPFPAPHFDDIHASAADTGRDLSLFGKTLDKSSSAHEAKDEVQSDAPTPPPPPAFFPAHTTPRSAHDSSGRTMAVHLPSELIGRLRLQGKRHGVPTLSPSLHSTFAMAMWAVLATSYPTSPDGTFTCTCMISNNLRKPATKDNHHPYLTGNYFSATVVPSPLSPSTNVWNAVRQLHRGFASPDAQKQRIGLVHTFKNMSTPDFMDLYRSRAAESKKTKDAHTSSVMFANLGLVPLPEGAEDYVWSQSSWPAGAALTVSIAASAKGTTACVYFRDGVAVTSEQVHQIFERWPRIIAKMADGYDEDLKGLEVQT